MALSFSQIEPAWSEWDRRDATRVPVDALIDCRPVGTSQFRRCSVLEVSTKAMKIVLDCWLPADTVINLVVRDSQGRSVRRLYGSVLRAEPSGTGWIHVVRAASHRLWPSTIIIDIVCSALDQQMCESADGAGLSVPSAWMSDAHISRKAREFISSGNP